MDDVRRASAADTKLDQGRVGMGLGKGSGVLLRGVTASFLSNDAFGHDDGNHAIVDCNFG
jgi:methyl coenzyme M reductase subunit C